MASGMPHLPQIIGNRARALIVTSVFVRIMQTYGSEMYRVLLGTSLLLLPRSLSGSRVESVQCAAQRDTAL